MIRTGLIGYGYWGQKLARNLAAADGTVLAAIADPSPEQLCHARCTYPGVATHADGATLLKYDDIDAVVIATPLSTHYGLSKMAIERGKHVLVEKPMAGSLAEAVALGELADKQDVRLMVDHTFLFDAAIRHMRSLIDANELGVLVYLDSVRTSLGLFRTDTNVLWDLAVHDLAITDYLLDERPISVSVNGARLATHEREYMAHITLHFNQPVLVHFHVNWLAPHKTRRLLLCGSRRMVEYDGLEARDRLRIHEAGIDIGRPSATDSTRTQVSYRNGGAYTAPVAPGEALSSVVAEFVEAIGERRRPFSDAHMGIRVVRLLEAAQQSLRAGGREICL